MSDNENESIESILATVRRAAQYYDDEAEGSEGLLRETFKLSAANYREIADRIEAAWKREREELDKRISDLEAYAKLWTGRADELRLKCYEFYAKAKPVGNEAAMREALVEIRDTINKWYDDDYISHGAFSVLWDLCSDALAAHARNCDLPLVVDGPADNNADKAWLVFKHHNPDAYFDVSGLLRCIDWLLAPAAERKGETDGR